MYTDRCTQTRWQSGRLGETYPSLAFGLCPDKVLKCYGVSGTCLFILLVLGNALTYKYSTGHVEYIFLGL